MSEVCECGHLLRVHTVGCPFCDCPAMPADPGPESSVTGHDERRAEIEAGEDHGGPAMADISAEREQQIADGVALDDEAKCCCDCGVGFGEKHNPMCGRVSIFHSTVTAEDVYVRSPGVPTARARDSQDRCPEHPLVGDPSCRDCQIESHDAWMHRAKAAEARLAELEEEDVMADDERRGEIEAVARAAYSRDRGAWDRLPEAQKAIHRERFARGIEALDRVRDAPRCGVCGMGPGQECEQMSGLRFEDCKAAQMNLYVPDVARSQQGEEN